VGDPGAQLLNGLMSMVDCFTKRALALTKVAAMPAGPIRMVHRQYL
jgi:hypothetical protein